MSIFFQFRLLLVPLALFSLQYTQIISFVMISPYYYISGSLSSLLLKKNRKKGSFLSLRKKKEKSNLTLSFSPTFASWSIFIFKVEVLASWIILHVWLLKNRWKILVYVWQLLKYFSRSFHQASYYNS